jgi:hypothetical protein
MPRRCCAALAVASLLAAAAAAEPRLYDRWRAASALAPSSPAQAADDWAAVPLRTGAHLPLNATQWHGKFRTTARAYNASLAVFDARDWSVALPPSGCTKHSVTSASARGAGCAYATNAGFFDFPPHAACEGNLALAGAVLQYQTPSRTNVAVNGTHALVGYSTSGTVAASAVSSLVSGLGWLVRDGADYVKSAREYSAGNSFFTEKAPRTGAGWRADGAGLLLTVDGIEGTSAAAGADLFEFTDLLIELGAVAAMNLDGGGSTTAALHGQVYNTPHCGDSWTVCERDVTSITCVNGK